MKDFTIKSQRRTCIFFVRYSCEKKCFRLGVIWSRGTSWLVSCSAGVFLSYKLTLIRRDLELLTQQILGTRKINPMWTSIRILLNFSSHNFNEWKEFRQIDISLQRLENNPTWWRHQMKTFSALLAFCAGSPVNSTHKGHAVTRSFDVSLIIHRPRARGVHHAPPP